MNDMCGCGHDKYDHEYSKGRIMSTHMVNGKLTTEETEGSIEMVGDCRMCPCKGFRMDLRPHEQPQRKKYEEWHGLSCDVCRERHNLSHPQHQQEKKTSYEKCDKHKLYDCRICSIHQPQTEETLNVRRHYQHDDGKFCDFPQPQTEPEQICGYCNHAHIPGSPHIYPQPQQERCKNHRWSNSTTLGMVCPDCNKYIAPQPSKEGDVRIEDILRDATFPTPVLKRVAIDSIQSLLKEERVRRDGQWAHELGKIGLEKDKFDDALASLTHDTTQE